MHFTKSLMLLAAVVSGALARPEGHVRRVENAQNIQITQNNQNAGSAGGASSSGSSEALSNWASVVANGLFSLQGFGGRTNASGEGDTYRGNVGAPYGSNIIHISAAEAHRYKYVVRFQGSNKVDWTVKIWNKIGPTGLMDGFYNVHDRYCKTFTLAPGAIKYVAFDENTQGAWAAAEGSEIPVNGVGSWAATWGEFDFGSSKNKWNPSGPPSKHGWSGFDVSAIQVQDANQAQGANLPVQGMKICDVRSNAGCSYITENAAQNYKAYFNGQRAIGGIGGKLPAGPVRLAVYIDYKGN